MSIKLEPRRIWVDGVLADQCSTRLHETEIPYIREDIVFSLIKALEVFQEHCESMADANWRRWEELASPIEYERWVKARAAHMAAQARAALAEARGE